MKLFLVLLVGLAAQCMASPNGAPRSEGICNSMVPSHEVEPEASISPYHLNVSATTVRGGERIEVEIYSDYEFEFKGFLLEARTNEEEFRIIGEFFSAEGETTKFNYRDCQGGNDNAVTHFDNSFKEKIKFSWQAPYNFNGSIHFRATVVQHKINFWVNQVSENIAIILSEQATTIYDECGKTKWCIGLPNGCIESENCVSFGAVIVKDEIFSFEMQSSISANYIALALSEDSKMGQDSAIECVLEGGDVKAYTSLTTATQSNYGAKRTDIDQGIIRLRSSKYENGAIYCLVERAAVTEVERLVFNLLKDSHYLLISSGSTGSLLSIGYHNINRGSSSSAIHFPDDPVALGSTGNQPTKTLVLIHGSFMVISWIGATSIGVFSARYLRKICVGKQVFGKDVWFIVHQVAMSITWVLTISAVVIIWVDVGEFKASNHSVLGITATVLCFIQPLSALFRPAPDHESRPIFNFMHGLVGKLAHLLAVITIFFATSMARADLPEWTKYILISYIVVYLIFYAAMTNVGIISEIKQKQLSDSLKDSEKKDLRPLLLTQRKIMFGVFTLCIISFVTTLITCILLET